MTPLEQAQQIEKLRQAQLLMQAQRQPQGGGLLGGMSVPQTYQQSPQEQGGTDYLGLAKQGKDASDLFQSGDGGGLGGYAAAAAAFGKFVDWGFDKDATGGGLGRRNVHWLEDAWQPIKGGISDGGDLIGNTANSVGDFFSGLF